MTDRYTPARKLSKEELLNALDRIDSIVERSGCGFDLTHDEHTQISEAILASDHQQKKIENLRSSLELCVRYLDHPEVQSISFALPASVPLKRALAALGES